MTTINYIIVEIDEAYKNEVDGIVVNSSIETVSNINRIAKVVEAPSFTIVKAGDEVIVHHNMFRMRNGIRGQKVNSDYYIEGNLYFIPLTLVFAYRRDGEEWQSIRPFVFVKPIDYKNEDVNGFTITKSETNSHKGKKKLTGTIEFINDELEVQGVKKGDEVLFSYHSEYEFNIEGVLLYKMSTKDILAVL